MSRWELRLRALIASTFIFAGILIAGAMFLLFAACLIVIAGVLT